MSKADTRLQAKITKLYIDMRLKRISKLDWMIESEQTVEALRQLEHTDIIPELFYAQLLITKNAQEAAEEILEEAADWLRVHSKESPVCHAYYLYLTTLTGDDESYDARVAAKLRELSSRYPHLWQIQWLLYYVDRELSDNALEQYHFLKRMFIRGCRSPLMYLEARALLERNPIFLYEFSEFEVQLMAFMVRHAGMSSRVSDILAEYMLTRTDYRYLYLMIMGSCYEASPSKRLLEGICKLLFLGGCTGERYVAWYRKGIAENVRIDGLFEAFMKSIPVEQWYLDGEELSEERRIPLEVMEYFAHAKALDDVRCAYLYAVVYKYRENWFSMYKLYEPLLRPFMMDRLYKGIVNPGLAYLYENLLQVSQLAKDKLELFLEVSHSCRISGLPKEAGTLRISYQHMTEEISVPYTEGEALLPIYGSQFTICVYDSIGRELFTESPMIIPLVHAEIWEDFFAGQELQNVLYHMARMEAITSVAELSGKEASAKVVLANEKISQSFKEEIAELLLPYWDMNGVYEEISAASPFVFSELGTYSKEKEARFWKRQYMNNRIGIYGVQFLLAHYEGTLQEQGSIFSKAAALGIETGAYARQLLFRMVEERQLLPHYVEIFDAYCRGEADTECLQGFIEFAAELSYRKEQQAPMPILHQQALLTEAGVVFSVQAQLEFLFSIVANGIGSMGQELSGTAAHYIKALLRQEIYFDWMQPMQVICAELAELEAFQVLEYRGREAGPVWVRFSKHTDGKENADSLQSEVMQMVCEGIYTKRFLMFYGERIHYEIFGLDGTEQHLLKQGVLQRGLSLEQGGSSRFARLNRMLALREKRDNLELYQELEAYYGQSAMAEQMFTLK